MPTAANPVDTIRIGTLVNGAGAADYIAQILPHGFETFELTWGWGKNPEQQDLPKLASELNAVMGGKASIAAIGMYGNPITSVEDAKQWEVLIDNAHYFGTDVVCGFAGADPSKAIHDHRDHVERVWIPLAERAKKRGVRLAWENCPMGGNWASPRYNIAINNDAWDLLFDWIGLDNVGLEWEPCHQLCQLIDPLPQLRQYVKRVFHVHGKDATIYRDVVARHGISGKETWCYHRTPGFGDTSWTDIISELRRSGFVGAIDIEGWHDPVYRDELEMTGQVHALHHLKACRTSYVANPVERKKQGGY
jgi:sugar phosphate isomerase/epimerase